MQRAQLRLIVLALAVASLAWIGYRVADMLANRRQDAVDTALRLLPDAAQRLQEFRRVKLEHGRRVWELSAQEAQYFDDAQQAVVRGPEMVFYTDGQEKARLSGEEGRLTFEGTDLRVVEMRGGVRVEGAGYVLETGVATYERARDVVVAPGSVRIAGHNLTVQGNEMEISVAARVLTLHRDVHVTLANPDGNGS
jgi:LPS export ABC transporter protein LptC